VRTVCPDEVVASHLPGDAVAVDEGDHRLVPDLPDPRVAHPEADIPAITRSRVGQVDEDVGLGIEPHGRTHEMLEVDPVALAPEAQLDALVLGAMGQDATVDAGIGEEPDAVLLQDARPMGVLDLMSSTGVDGDRVDAALRQEVREHEAGGTRADDTDDRRLLDGLRSHTSCLPSCGAPWVRRAWGSARARRSSP
jgi:hypothetical protein